MAPVPQTARTPKARLARQAVFFAVMLVIGIGGCGAGIMISNHVKGNDPAMGVLIWTGIAEILLGLVGLVGLLVTAIRAVFETRSDGSPDQP